MELTLVLQGSGTRFIGDAITHVRAPDLVLIGPDLPHYWDMRNHTSGYAVQFDFPDGHPFWSFPKQARWARS
jgi:mannose-6-phosphate isomerase-like protein (cupin superfamily)